MAQVGTSKIVWGRGNIDCQCLIAGPLVRVEAIASFLSPQRSGLMTVLRQKRKLTGNVTVWQESECLESCPRPRLADRHVRWGEVLRGLL